MKTFAYICGLILWFFLAVILTTLIGAFCGWVVGWFFGDTILGILASFGVKGFAMWQIGAFLGFVGGVFKSTTINKNVNQRNSDF